MKRKVFAIGMGLVFILLGALLFFRSSNTPPLESLKINLVALPTAALIHIAEAQGYFKDEGLQITYQTFTSGRDALQNVLDGKADLATVFETPFVRHVYEGRPVRILTMLHTSNKDTAVVADRRKGINSPIDLKGKRVALSKNTSGEFFFLQFLTELGLKISDVKIVDMQPTQIVSALTNDTVDAIATWQPYVFDAVASLGRENAQTFYSSLYSEISLLVGTQNTVDKKKSALLRMLRALSHAEEYLRANPLESLAIVEKSLPSMSKEKVEYIWPLLQIRLGFNNVLLTTLLAEAEWFKAQEIYITLIPDFRATMIDSYLKSIRPDLVTVY